MFIPLGLGNWPRLFPLTVFCLVLSNFVYSVYRFDDVKAYSKALENNENRQKLVETTLTVLVKSCVQKFSQAGCLSNFKKWKPNSSEKKMKNELNKVIAKLYPEESNSSANNPPVNVSEPDKAQTLQIALFLKNFGHDYKNWPDSAKQLPEYRQFLAYHHNLNQAKIMLGQQMNLLTPQNLSLRTLVEAGFSHGSWPHLLGNMFVLLVFGMHLEIAIGELLFFLLFFGGSYAGLLLQISTMTESSILLGASAGCSAVLGGYLVMFYRSRMLFWFSMWFVYNRKIYLPVIATIPFFYVVGDLVGVMNPAASNVAHLAHLGGLVWGMVIAFLFHWTSTIRPPYLFEREALLAYQAKSEHDPKRKLKLLVEANRWNYQNSRTVTKILQTAEESNLQLSKDDRKVLEHSLKQVIAIDFQKNEFKPLMILSKTSLRHFEAREIFSDVPWQKILRLADYHLDQSDFDTALRLYYHVLNMHIGRTNKLKIEKTCQNIENHLQELNHVS